MDAKQRQRRTAPTQCYEARLMGFVHLLDLKLSTWAFVAGKFVERAILPGGEVLKCEIEAKDRRVAERSEIRIRNQKKPTERLSMFAVQSSTTERWKHENRNEKVRLPLQCLEWMLAGFRESNSSTDNHLQILHEFFPSDWTFRRLMTSCECQVSNVKKKSFEDLHRFDGGGRGRPSKCKLAEGTLKFSKKKLNGIMKIVLDEEKNFSFPPFRPHHPRQTVLPSPLHCSNSNFSPLSLYSFLFMLCIRLHLKIDEVWAKRKAAKKKRRATTRFNRMNIDLLFRSSHHQKQLITLVEEREQMLRPTMLRCEEGEGERECVGDPLRGAVQRASEKIKEKSKEKNRRKNLKIENKSERTHSASVKSLHSEVKFRFFLLVEHNKNVVW